MLSESSSQPILASAVIDIFQAFFQTHPSLKNSLTLSQLQRFLIFAHRLSREFASPPLELPISYQTFLGHVLNLDLNTIQLCWSSLKDVVAAWEAFNLNDQDDLFRLHGPSTAVGECYLFVTIAKITTVLCTGAYHLLPPLITCLSSQCSQRSLSEPKDVYGRLFTLRQGILPVVSTSKYCRRK